MACRDQVTRRHSGVKAPKRLAVDFPGCMSARCGAARRRGEHAWPTPIAALLSAGITPLYYISTDYAETPVATVESEISDAVSW
jgi:hypothetical protein